MIIIAFSGGQKLMEKRAGTNFRDFYYMSGVRKKGKHSVCFFACRCIYSSCTVMAVSCNMYGSQQQPPSSLHKQFETGKAGQLQAVKLPTIYAKCGGIIIARVIGGRHM